MDSSPFLQCSEITLLNIWLNRKSNSMWTRCLIAIQMENESPLDSGKGCHLLFKILQTIEVGAELVYHLNDKESWPA